MFAASRIHIRGRNAVFAASEMLGAGRQDAGSRKALLAASRLLERGRQCLVSGGSWSMKAVCACKEDLNSPCDTGRDLEVGIQ